MGSYTSPASLLYLCQITTEDGMLWVQLPIRGTWLYLLFLNDMTTETSKPVRNQLLDEEGQVPAEPSTTVRNYVKEVDLPKAFVEVVQSPGHVLDLPQSSECWAASIPTNIFLTFPPVKRLGITSTTAELRRLPYMHKEETVWPWAWPAQHKSPHQSPAWT